MNMTILRARTENGNFGMFLDQSGMPFAVTAELPWKNNTPFISCFPDGVYLCKRVDSPKFGNTFEVTDVPDRTHILFHKANVPHRDLKGCVGVGEKFEDVGGEDAIQESRKGFSEFLQLTKGLESFTLHVRTVNW